MNEPELKRMKRFKRDTAAEPDRIKRVKHDADLELIRTKRAKRAVVEKLEGPNREMEEEEHTLIRVKRGRRDTEQELSRVKREQRETLEDSDTALSRQKRFKRSSHINKHLTQQLHHKQKRSNKHDLHQIRKSLAQSLDKIKRSKRAEVKKGELFSKHPSRIHIREKRRHPLVLENHLKTAKKDTHLTAVVRKAMDTWRRGKRRLAADDKRENDKKLHRAKRSGKTKHTSVLKDIKRDISRLQRLKKGIAHAVIRDVKRQNKLHHLSKRHEVFKPAHNDGKQINKITKP